MSSKQLEERRERELIALVATKLDLSVHQLEELDWDLDEDVGNDGTVYGYTVTFRPSRDPDAQDLIDRVTDRQGRVQFGPDL